MYVLAKGSVELHQANGNVLTTLHDGACVGELALLTSKGKHLASATATTDVVVLEISRANLHALIHDNTGIARGVLDALASTLRWTYLQVSIYLSMLKEDSVDILCSSGDVARVDRRDESTEAPRLCVSSVGGRQC